MKQSGIDYDTKIQNALRQAIRSVLKDVESDGLPGEHHFYIAFKTQAAGVTLSQKLRKRFPDEMTIILQHKFWDLAIEDDYFQVVLSFDQQPETIRIPFAAMTGFVDPSVNFALQLHTQDKESLTLANQTDNKKIQDDHKTSEDEKNITPSRDISSIASSKPKSRQNTKDDQPIKPEDEGAKVVTLDQFRKK